MSGRAGDRPSDEPLCRAELPGGIALHYLERGAGPPLLLLHGGMGDCRSWAPQVAAFAPRFRVVAFSRRHASPNRNPAGPDLSLADEVDDLASFMAGLGVGPAHLVGTSYGALVALAYALREPAQVRSLVLAEPPLHRWATRSPEGARLHADFMSGAWHAAGTAFARGDDERALRLLVDGMEGRPIFDALAPERVAAARRNLGAMRALTRSNDPFPDLDRSAVAAIAAPMLLLRGERTSALHRCVLDELADVVAAASCKVVPAAGHGSASENPAAFNAAVLGFLDRVSGGAPAASEPPYPASLALDRAR